MKYEVVNDVTRMFKTLGAVTMLKDWERIPKKLKRGTWEYYDRVAAQHYFNKEGLEIGYLVPTLMGVDKKDQGVVIFPAPVKWDMGGPNDPEIQKI